MEIAELGCVGDKRHMEMKGVMNCSILCFLLLNNVSSVALIMLI